MITVKAKLDLRRTTKGRRVIRLAESTPRPVAPVRVPRISRLVALAIRFDRLLREGKVGSVSELAALAHVTQPRATQILNLTLLAPDIQAQLMHLAPVERGRAQIHERMLRPLTAIDDWREQRSRWRRVRPGGDIRPARASRDTSSRTESHVGAFGRKESHADAPS